MCQIQKGHPQLPGTSSVMHRDACKWVLGGCSIGHKAHMSLRGLEPEKRPADAQHNSHWLAPAQTAGGLPCYPFGSQAHTVKQLVPSHMSKYAFLINGIVIALRVPCRLKADRDQLCQKKSQRERKSCRESSQQLFTAEPEGHLRRSRLIHWLTMILMSRGGETPTLWI